MRRSDRIAWWVFGIGLVAIFGGIGVFGMVAEDPPPQPAYEFEFCPADAGGAARADTRYEEKADPYQGRGPHPVAVEAGKSRMDKLDLPGRWASGEWGNPPRPRLVACVYQDVTLPAKERICRYVPETTMGMRGLGSRPVRDELTTKVQLMKATYVFQLYEAKTAKPVGRAEVPGEADCPYHYKVGSGDTIPQDPDGKKLRKALSPFVERTIS